MSDYSTVKIITTSNDFFEGLDNNLFQHQNWSVSEEAERDVRMWLEECENRDWTFTMPEEPVNGTYPVRILER